jgi:GNAT superfamily N-acetyltransferase
MPNCRFRLGEKKDLPQVFDLIKELAIYEKAPEQVTNTIEAMVEDGFGAHPIYGLFVAEKDDKIIGISVYYYRYSTWKGKRLYLEDIVVTEKERGRGVGRVLFDMTMKKALEENCTGMMWQVLDWNKPAIYFYQKTYKAKMDEEWLNCHLEKEEMIQLLSTDSK